MTQATQTKHEWLLDHKQNEALLKTLRELREILEDYEFAQQDLLTCHERVRANLVQLLTAFEENTDLIEMLGA